MLVGLHVPTNFQIYTDKTLKKHYGGGGLSGYTNGWQCQGSRYNYLGNLRAKRAANLKILVCLVVFLCWIKRFVLLSLCLNVNIWIDIFQAFKNRGGDDPPQKNSRGGHVPPVPPGIAAYVHVNVAWIIDELRNGENKTFQMLGTDMCFHKHLCHLAE